MRLTDAHRASRRKLTFDELEALRQILVSLRGDIRRVVVGTEEMDGKDVKSAEGGFSPGPMVMALLRPQAA